MRKPTGSRNGSRLRVAKEEFPAGSLEADLAAIGDSIPDEDLAKFPPDYFANLDHYLYGAPKKK